MNRSNRLVAPIFALLLSHALTAMAEENNIVASTVVLNGLTSLLGADRVFLQVYPAHFSPEAISLTTGETACGIKLLSVDVRAAAVRIENHGQIQTIKMRSSPELADSIVAANSNGDAGSTLVHSPAESASFTLTHQLLGSSSGQPDSLSSGLALVGGGVANAIKASPSKQTSAGDNSNSDTNSGTEASSPKTHIYYWWMEDAKKIEQSRLATAAQVLAGELPAEPLTPLTPPGTPANLIGPYSVYLEHGRGVVVSD